MSCHYIINYILKEDANDNKPTKGRADYGGFIYQ